MPYTMQQIPEIGGLIVRGTMQLFAMSAVKRRCNSECAVMKDTVVWKWEWARSRFHLFRCESTLYLIVIQEVQPRSTDGDNGHPLRLSSESLEIFNTSLGFVHSVNTHGKPAHEVNQEPERTKRHCEYCGNCSW